MKHIFASTKWLCSHHFSLRSFPSAQLRQKQNRLQWDPSHIYPTRLTNTNSQNALCWRLVWASVLQCPLHLPARTPSHPVSMQINYAICVFHYSPQTGIVHLTSIEACVRMLLARSRWKLSEECCGFIKLHFIVHSRPPRGRYRRSSIFGLEGKLRLDVM